MNIIIKIIRRIKEKFVKQEESREFVKPINNDMISNYHVGKYNDSKVFEEDIRRAMFDALTSSNEDFDKNIGKVDLIFAMKEAEEKSQRRQVTQEIEESSLEGGYQKTLSLRRSQYTIH